MAEGKARAARTDRMISVDALRGFDMFWIIGGGELIRNLINLIAGATPPGVARQFEHVEWTGFNAWDLIMPLFLFIVGAALPFSMSKRIAEPSDRRKVYRRILKRFAILFILGMVAQGNLLFFDPSRIHIYCNTLQAIAVGYAVAAVAVMNLNVTWQGVLSAVLLIGYWAIMSFTPFAGYPAGTVEPNANLALFIDKAVLGRFQDGTTYTWILSGMTFSVTVLLGVMSGHILRAKIAPVRKLAALAAAGIAGVAAGLAFSPWCPIVKHIWSSSFTLFSAGLCFLLLALFYYVLDMLKFRSWAFFFIVIGSNALFIYMFSEIISVYTPEVVKAAISHSGIAVQATVFVGIFVAQWLLLYWMYRRKIFLRV